MSDERRQETAGGNTVIGVAFADPVDRSLLADYLRELGHEVITVSGEPAQTPVDLFIFDVPTARRLGRWALGLKAEDPTYLPVIVGLGPKDAPEPWLDAGFDHYLRLPFNKATLKSLIGLLLRQRRQTLELARLSESRYRAVFEATGTATIVVEADGTITLANRECLRVTGYTPEELVGTKWMDYVAPENLERMLAYHAARRREEPSVPDIYETRLVNKAGQVRETVLYVRVVPETKQSVVSLVDVTPEREARHALEESEAFFKNLFEQHSAPMLLVDPETDRILDANQAAAEFYGWPRAKLRLMTVRDITAAPVNELWEARRLVLARKRSRFELVIRRMDGSLVEAELFSAAIETSRGTVVHTIVHDISARRQAEAAKLELERRLGQAEKMEAIGRLAGGIAHDFNNTLTAIIGYSDLLLADEKRCPPDVLADIHEIRASAERAAGLTRQILAMSRHQPLQTEVVSLNDVLADMASLLRRTIGENIELCLDPSEDKPCVQADVFRLQQAIINLAVNAKDAMPDGGRLNFKTRLLDLDEGFCRLHPPLRPGCYALLSISDTGTGIEPDVLPHIFEPFFTTKPLGLGTGLGLSTVHGLVSQMGGAIFVSSEPGKGTTFDLYMPAVKAAGSER